MTSDDPQILERGLLGMSDEAWERLRQQDEVIAPLAAMATVTHGAADSGAEELGLSRRQVYTLIGRRRKGAGLLTDLAPGRSAGGRGGRRLPEPVEAVIREVIRKSYLTKQKPSLAVVHRQIVRECKTQGLTAPARHTVALRIEALHPVEVRRRREGREAARSLQSAGGKVPETVAPLDQVQIDHTVIDLLVVDDRDRQPVELQQGLSAERAVFEATFRNVEADGSTWIYHLALMGEESGGLDESIPIDADHAAYSRSVKEPGWEELEPRFMLTPNHPLEAMKRWTATGHE